MDQLAGGTSAAIPAGDGDRIFSDRFEDRSHDAEDFARQVLERFTYGARPEDISHFLSLGSNPEDRLAAWATWQLDWHAINDPELSARLSAANYQTLDKSITQLWADHVRGEMTNWPDRYRPVAETDAARILRATYSRRQLYEMMVEFWHDHFNVAGWDFSIAPVFVQHDRDAIRPQALGNFRQMLEAVAKSTAMLYYLDNRANRTGGYNENWARELMELHTLGVDVYYPGASHGAIPIGADGQAIGYSDADVYDVARCFTGWTVRNGHWQFPPGPEYDTGEFFYFSNWHEGGQKNVLGQWVPLPGQPGGQQEAHVVMDRLCTHPATARHICRKLCRRYISDDPPQSLVESAASVWLENWQEPDQVARVMLHIMTSDEVLNGQGAKIRRPFEMVIATLRKTAAEIEPRHFGEWAPYGEFFSRFQQTGHGSFRWPAPDGYPDTAQRWTSVSVMGQSWRLLSRLPELRYPDGGAFLLRIHELTVQAFPNPSQHTAANLVDWWLTRLIGRPVSALRRQELIDFLRQNAAADAPLDIVDNAPYGNWSQNNLSAHYTPVRLRAMVSLITMLPEFHQR
ncbi:MAG: DUF1800 domain-containing protein [Wenzhouxiangella sp.]|nr:MAG: DUF1800 domain-containing protein [Wenzhouxiangella sp.]